MTAAMRRSVLSVVLAIAASLTVSACKQGRNERCQVQSDCDDGLICSLATQECSDQTNSGIDASLPVDAAPDAPPDAP
jgi:hypothetical protein